MITEVLVQLLRACHIKFQAPKQKPVFQHLPHTVKVLYIALA